MLCLTLLSISVIVTVLGLVFGAPGLVGKKLIASVCETLGKNQSQICFCVNRPQSPQLATQGTMLASFVLGSDAAERSQREKQAGWAKTDREDLVDHSVAALCLSVVFATLIYASEQELAIYK